jgi:hypothetical protein
MLWTVTYSYKNLHNVKNTWEKVRKVIKSNKSFNWNNFWALELAAKIA